MPRSSSKLWPPSRAPRSVRSAMSHLPNLVPRKIACPRPMAPRARRSTSESVYPLLSVSIRSTVGGSARFRESGPMTALTGSSQRPASDDGRHRVAGLLDPAARIDPDQQEDAEHEQHHQSEQGRTVGVRPLVHQAEDQGADPARAAFARLVEREVLRL